MPLPFIAAILTAGGVSAASTAVAFAGSGLAKAAFWSKVGYSFLIGSAVAALSHQSRPNPDAIQRPPVESNASTDIGAKQ